jgi:hypothetical protein
MIQPSFLGCYDTTTIIIVALFIKKTLRLVYNGDYRSKLAHFEEQKIFFAFLYSHSLERLSP